MKLTGADIIIECLVEQGVDTVFGYPGGQVIPLYDALYRCGGRIRHILTAHEQGASHAADGYARSTGKTGVCIATSGPGATNLVTGLATAYMDSVPVVAITGNVPLSLLGRDSFQEVDITGITMNITKHNYIVKDIKDLASTVREAFYIANEGRPGPVLIDVPKDIQVAEYEYEKAEPRKIVPVASRLREKDLEAAAKLILSSERPMCYVGGGVIRSDASEYLNEFLDMIDAPCGSSLMGLGAVDCSSDRFTGMIGMHGTRVSNMSINNCDLLIVIGARFSDRVISKSSTFARQAKIIQIDVDPAEFNKNIISEVHIVADLRIALPRLMKKIGKKLDHRLWIDTIKDAKRRYPMRVSTDAERAKKILSALEKVLPENSYITTEVGQHQMWAAQFLMNHKPRHFLTSGGLGTMGYGTGAAIGTQVSHPDARVVNIAGDGSFRMNCNELATIARYRLPVIIIVMNNHALGMVRQWQTLFYESHYSETTLETPLDWVMLANAYGVDGMRIGPDDDPEAVIAAAVSLGKPVVIDAYIPSDDKVYPMVAPGASISDMLGYVDMQDNS